MEVEIGSHHVSPEFRRRCSPRPGQLEQTEQVSLKRLRGPRALEHKLPLIPEWVLDTSLVLNKIDRDALKRGYRARRQSIRLFQLLTAGWSGNAQED